MRLIRRLSDPEWWLSETRRSTMVTVVALVLILPATSVLSRRSDDTIAPIDVVLLVMAVYLAAYVAITVFSQRGSSEEQVRDWARHLGRGTWSRRYIAGSGPGPGLPIFVGALALLTGVVWLPRGEVLDSELALGPRLVVGVALIVVAWLTLNVCFAEAYRVEDQLGDEPVFRWSDGAAATRVWSDYLYLATSLSTSFGSNDVKVVDAAARRPMAVHVVVAFVYNTVILGAVVSTVVTL